MGQNKLAAPFACCQEIVTFPPNLLSRLIQLHFVPQLFFQQ